MADKLNESNESNVDYGMHYDYLYVGMSGEKMIDAINSNFHATDATFLAQSNAILARIISNDIKQIKVEDGIVYYTTSTKEPLEWKSMAATWGQIGGTLTDQTDLQEMLNTKVSNSTFKETKAQVETNTNNITELFTDTNTLASNLNSLDNQINSSTGIAYRLAVVEESNESKISSPTVKLIRQVGTSLEYSVNGEEWLPVSSAGLVEWGNIDGDIKNQRDLWLLLDDFNAHTKNTENPHNVTKTQIGLSHVDNTADIDKPVSTLQQAAIDAGLTSLRVKALTKSEYEALDSIDASTVYLLTDVNN